MTVLVAAIVGAVVSLGVLVRYLPHRLVRGGLGVDHWYWKLYLETYWRDERFPPELPQYLLDKHQWYPPLFILLIAKLPRRIFERYSHLVGLAIDVVHLLTAMAIAGALSSGNPVSVIVTGLVYAMTPIMVSYNVQLNPRGLGALFLDLQVLLVMIIVMGGVESQWWWSLVYVLGALILMTHKMTSQLMLFLVLMGTILLGDWRVAAIIPVSMLVAWILSGGFYWKVLLAHWDVVTFWHRNWRWLMAHPVKDSPIYADTRQPAQPRFFLPGIKGILKHARYLIAYNPWAWLVFPLLASNLLNASQLFMLAWVALVATFGIATVAIPQLRCFGAGYLYIYNTALPAALIWGGVAGEPMTSQALFFGLLAAVGAVAAIVVFYRSVLKSKTMKADGDFQNVINWLQRSERGTVMCLPIMWYDIIAYRTGQPVLYGGHGYGFKEFEPTCPRLLSPLPDLARKYEIRYLVTMEGYLNDSFIKDIRCDSMLHFGPYIVYILASYDDLLPSVPD